MSIRYLIGSPELDAAEIEDERRADARVPFGPVADDVAAEMAAALGWDSGPTQDEWEAMRAEWVADSERNKAAASA